MRRQSEIEFVRQMGFDMDRPDHQLYVALMFQPRLVVCLIAVGIVFQSAGLFLVMSAALWWGTVFPTRNLFDAAYNRLFASPRGLPRVPIAPAPRRFAQAMAGTMALAVGASVLSGTSLVAWLLEGLFAIGATSAVVGRLCGPAVLYLRFMGTAGRASSVARRA